MSKRVDHTGSRFGSWVAVAIDRTNGHRTWWRVRCDCGAAAVVRADSLTTGGSKRCVTCQSEVSRQTHTRHGETRDPTWRSWASMRERCENPNFSAFKDYGGRGVKVSARWQSYEAFVQDVGYRPAGTTLDRIDCSGDYEPGNCRWATPKQQARNKRRTVYLEVNGERKSLSEWAEDRGFSHITFYKRYAAGWSDQDIVNTPKLAKSSPKPRGQNSRRSTARRLPSP